MDTVFPRRMYLRRALLGGILAWLALFLLCFLLASADFFGDRLDLMDALSRLQLSPDRAYLAFGRSRVLANLYESAAVFAAEMARRGTGEFVLAHLSAENNTPERALSAVRRALADAGFDLPLETAPRSGLSRCFGREGAGCSE